MYNIINKYIHYTHIAETKQAIFRIIKHLMQIQSKIPK